MTKNDLIHLASMGLFGLGVMGAWANVFYMTHRQRHDPAGWQHRRTPGLVRTAVLGTLGAIGLLASTVNWRFLVG